MEKRAKWKNEADGNLGGCDCKICRNKGVVFSVKDGYIVSYECECMGKRRSILNIEKSGMKELIGRYTFENFIVKTVWQSDMKKKARNFLQDETGSWFSALGSVGAGKTHICTAICAEMLNSGRAVRYMLWRDESVRLKSAVGDEERYSEMIRPLKRTKVLYIDDLFKTRSGEEIRAADINLAFEILNYRYCNKDLVTIISSEKTMDDLIKIDEAIGSRIYERSKDFCVQLGGNKNFRMN